MYPRLNSHSLSVLLREFCLSLLRMLFILSIATLGIGLNLLPILSDWFSLWPAFVVLVWTMLLPSYLTIMIAWFLGLIVDSLYGSYLGIHALALSFISYLSCYLSLPDEFTPYERIMPVMMLFFSYQVILWLIQRIVGVPTNLSIVKLVIATVCNTTLWFYCINKIQVFYKALHPEGSSLLWLLPK